MSRRSPMQRYVTPQSIKERVLRRQGKLMLDFTP
jgi:hypothetical protein